jgi:acetolactate synthase I/II/III large subunit
MVKVSDYIFNRLSKDFGVRHVFLISGGGNMHLLDSVGRNSEINYISTHHEQAAAIAAECYARLFGKFGVCLVTTGPGATNAITGVLGAWLDSIPVLYISGQVKREVQKSGQLRQLGDQEADIVAMVKPITKYAVMVTNPKDVRYHLEKAVHLAISGRPGPVWLDIPLDIQGALVEEQELAEFNVQEEMPEIKKDFAKQAKEVLEKIRGSKRPVLLAGNGIRLAGAQKEFLALAEELKIPVLTSMAGVDLIPSDHEYYFGRLGSVGQRATNFIVQNSDVFFSLGARMNLRVVTFNWKTFAREAFKIMVDIDLEELNKKTVSPDLAIVADAKEFILELGRQLKNHPLEKKPEWLKYCRAMKEKYPVITPDQRQGSVYIHSHVFVEKLSEMLPNESVVVMGDGLACEAPYHAFKIKDGQRLILNSGCAAMGYDLPASIGACFAHGNKPVICLTGDGSIMLNLQELQTIAHHKLPIKIFLFENGGYLSIRRTQDNLFKGFHVGSDSDSGVSCPDFIKIAKAFGLSSYEMHTHAEMEPVIKEVLAGPGPALCVVHMDPEEKLIPKLASKLNPDGSMVSPPLEDMFPFLEREEFKNNMIIKPLKESL